MKICRYLVILFSSLTLMLVLPSLLPGWMSSADASPKTASTPPFGTILSLEGEGIPQRT